MVVLPFYNFASFTTEITLENIPLKIAFNWNVRGQFWTAIIKDSNDNVLYAGLKVVINYELIQDYPDIGLPPGGLVAIDTTNTLERIGRDDLGVESFLIYAEEEEVAAI